MARVLKAVLLVRSLAVVSADSRFLVIQATDNYDTPVCVGVVGGEAQTVNCQFNDADSSHLWEFTSSKLKNSGSGKCMSVGDEKVGDTENFPIEMKECDESVTWKTTENGGGLFFEVEISGKTYSEYCLDVRGTPGLTSGLLFDVTPECELPGAEYYEMFDTEVTDQRMYFQEAEGQAEQEEAQQEEAQPDEQDDCKGTGKGSGKSGKSAKANCDRSALYSKDSARLRYGVGSPLAGLVVVVAGAAGALAASRP